MVISQFAVFYVGFSLGSICRKLAAKAVPSVPPQNLIPLTKLQKLILLGTFDLTWVRSGGMQYAGLLTTSTQNTWPERTGISPIAI